MEDLEARWWRGCDGFVVALAGGPCPGRHGVAAASGQRAGHLFVLVAEQVKPVAADVCEAQSAPGADALADDHPHPAGQDDRPSTPVISATWAPGLAWLRLHKAGSIAHCPSAWVARKDGDPHQSSIVGPSASTRRAHRIGRH